MFVTLTAFDFSVRAYIYYLHTPCMNTRYIVQTYNTRLLLSMSSVCSHIGFSRIHPVNTFAEDHQKSLLYFDFYCFLNCVLLCGYWRSFSIFVDNFLSQLWCKDQCIMNVMKLKYDSTNFISFHSLIKTPLESLIREKTYQHIRLALLESTNLLISERYCLPNNTMT